MMGDVALQASEEEAVKSKTAGRSEVLVMMERKLLMLEEGREKMGIVC